MHTLETDRLILREPRLEDFEGYAAMWAQPEVMRFISLEGQPLSRVAAWHSFSGQVGHWHLRGFGMFSVIERASGAFVGRVGPWYPEGWPDFEIGWCLRTEYWGQGYASEAARASIDDAFTRLQRSHLISLILPGNTRSIAVAERLGERLDGEITLAHAPNRAVLQYSLSQEVWRQRCPQWHGEK